MLVSISPTTRTAARKARARLVPQVTPGVMPLQVKKTLACGNSISRPRCSPDASRMRLSVTPIVHAKDFHALPDFTLAASPSMNLDHPKGYDSPQSPDSFAERRLASPSHARPSPFAHQLLRHVLPAGLVSSVHHSLRFIPRNAHRALTSSSTSRAARNNSLYLTKQTRHNERMNLSGASGTPLAACTRKRHATGEQQAARQTAAFAADAPAGYARRYASSGKENVGLW